MRKDDCRRFAIHRLTIIHWEPFDVAQGERNLSLSDHVSTSLQVINFSLAPTLSRQN